MVLLDISNYQHPWPAAQAKAEGCDAVIVGCQRPGLALSIIRECNWAGLPVIGLYAFLYWGVDTLGQTRAAINVAKETGQQMVWLDVEFSDDADPTVSAWKRCEELAECVTAVQDAGLNAGIYTGRPWWTDKMGNSHDFSHLPLWHSDYGANDATKEPVTKVSYGGWTDVAIHQYTSQYPIAGMLLDANYNFMENEMTTEERAELDLLKRQVYQLQTQIYGENPPAIQEGYADYNLYQVADFINGHQPHVGGAGAPGATVTGTFVGTVQ